MVMDCCCHVGDSIGCRIGSELDGVECDIVCRGAYDGWLEMSAVAGQGHIGQELPGLLKRNYENRTGMKRSSDAFTLAMKRGLSCLSRPPYYKGRAL
jgi:hypothetical protein